MIAFGRVGNPSVAVHITEPLPVFAIGKGPVGIVVHQTMPLSITIFPRHLVSQQGGSDGLAVRPPELHVVPVLLDRFAMHINEVEKPAVFLVPSPLPHVIKHAATEGREPCVSSSPLRLVQDEPGRLDGVPGIEGPPVHMIAQ